MASLATTACRLSARALRAQVVSKSTNRSYRTSTRCLAAQNFTMPALSPTMTEGNISAWKVKEGDSFVAGDVLLEIETDKATMDVEAQDDGVVMKIMTGDGAKAVQVGTRIAVMAEEGDDISKLEIPAEEKQAAPPKEEPKPEKKEGKKEAKEARPTPSGEKHKQKYPLLPSVQHLVKEHGLDEAAVEGIKPTGPNGRLLKGDVLAHLGSIKSDTPGKVSARFEKLSHLDLSNIKVAPRKEAPKKQEKPSAPLIPQAAEIAVPISLAKVIEVQKKIQSSIGTFLPLSAFLTRAVEAANDDLPPAAQAPTSDDLFNAVLGLDAVPTATRGVYDPEIQALPEASFAKSQPSKPDIIDILAGPSKKTAPAPAPPSFVPGVSTGTNVFRLVVPKAEEKRASVFLERMKIILEKEPGRLVL